MRTRKVYEREVCELRPANVYANGVAGELELIRSRFLELFRAHLEEIVRRHIRVQHPSLRTPECQLHIPRLCQGRPKLYFVYFVLTFAVSLVFPSDGDLTFPRLRRIGMGESTLERAPSTCASVPRHVNLLEHISDGGG